MLFYLEPSEKVSIEQLKEKNQTCEICYSKVIENKQISLFYKFIEVEKEDPLVKKFNKNVFIVNKNTMNGFDFILSVYNLKDDLGWIVPDDRIKDSNFYEFNQYLSSVTTSNSPNFSIRLFISDKYRAYNRTYSKLQDFLANIGGFMKLTMTVLNLFTLVIRTYLIDLHIIRKQFGDNHDLNLLMEENIRRSTKNEKNDKNNKSGNSISNITQHKGLLDNSQKIEKSKLFYF